MIQIPLQEYERSVLEKEKLRKRVEYLENVRAEDIANIGKLRDSIEYMESKISYTENPIEQFMLNNKLSLDCPFSIIYDSEGFGGGQFNDEPEEYQYKFLCGYLYGNASFELINCAKGNRDDRMLVGLLNGEWLVHKRL